MKKGQKLWTRDELILAINLYCKIPFGKIHHSNIEIIKLSDLIGRSPSSVSYKLSNFASLDPSLQARGIKGAYHTSKLDREIWEEFYQNWNILPYESEKLRANLENTTLEKIHHIAETEFPQEGKEKERLIKTRVNQAFFRKTVITAYNHTCCITGLKNSDLLIAGHISPWSSDEKNRLNPSNGISLNSLHDRAFELGLITVTPKYKIKISSILKRDSSKPIVELFNKYDDKKIILPSRFLPDVELLKYHNNERFKL